MAYRAEEIIARRPILRGVFRAYDEDGRLVGEAVNTIQAAGITEMLNVAAGISGTAFGGTSVLEVASAVGGAATVTLSGCVAGYPNAATLSVETASIVWKWSDASGTGYTPKEVRFKNSTGVMWSKNDQINDGVTSGLQWGAKPAGNTWQYSYTLSAIGSTSGNSGGGPSGHPFPCGPGLVALLNGMSGQLSAPFSAAHTWLDIVQGASAGTVTSGAAYSVAVSGGTITWVFKVNKGLTGTNGWLTPLISVDNNQLFCDRDDPVSTTNNTQIDYTFSATFS